MISFSKLINHLNKEQKPLPDSIMSLGKLKKTNEHNPLFEYLQSIGGSVNRRQVGNLANNSGGLKGATDVVSRESFVGFPDPPIKDFDLILSHDNFSIINSILNLVTIFPTDYNSLKNNLISYLTNYTIVYSKILKDYKLTSTKLTYYLDSNLDCEDLLLLVSLAFQLNIIVITSNKKSLIFSPVDLDRFYLILYQDQHFKYHAVKYQPNNASNLSYFLGTLNLMEPDHPLIKHALASA